MAHLRTVWPLIVSIGVLTVLCVICLTASLAQNSGHLSYALDDAYIHMATAKHFHEDGVWGVTRYGFTWACSSLLWPVLLWVTFVLFGVRDIIPLVFSYLFACGLCFAFYYKLTASWRLSRGLTFLGLLSVILLAPLVPLVFTGLEHTLHCLAALLLLCVSVECLANPRPKSTTRAAMVALTALVVMVRYEGLFEVVVIAALLLVRRRFRDALFVGLAAITPLVVGGWISVRHGWFVLPTPIVLKPKLASFSLQRIANLVVIDWAWHCPHMVFLILAALVILGLVIHYRRNIWDRTALLAGICVATTILHMQLAHWNSFYRYETYLVCLGIFVLFAALGEHCAAVGAWLRRWRTAYLALGCAAATAILAYSFEHRIHALFTVPRAMGNIYNQQTQMAFFLDEFYRGEEIAVNDIGAVNYYADVRCHDLWGLANLDVAKRRLSEDIDDLIITIPKGETRARIAIAYEMWFLVPDSWIEVGKWKIPNNWVCTYPKVTFYVLDQDEAQSLIDNLRAFSDRLPEDIQQSGLYCELPDGKWPGLENLSDRWWPSLDMQEQ